MSSIRSTREYPAVALHELALLNESQRAQLLSRAEDDLDSFLQGVKPIIDAVRDDGDEALARFARQYDGAQSLQPSEIAATPADFDAAFDQLDADMIETLEYAADNIRRFHQAQMPTEMWMKEIRPGVLVGERATAIDSVACYSPRGKGSFPSVTLMMERLTRQPWLLRAWLESNASTKLVVHNLWRLPLLGQRRFRVVQNSSVPAAPGLSLPNACSPDVSIPVCLPGPVRQLSWQMRV
jgi:hypothetical protein